MSKVLVASADPQLIAVASGVLRRLESQCVVVATEEGIVHGLHQDDTDLLLLDRRLPAFPEREFLQRLAADPLAGEVPVLLIGAFADHEEQLGLVDAGVSEFIAQPVDPGMLAVRIKSLLRLARRLDQMRAQALIDELTGVYNRRYLEGHLSAKFGEAKRYQHPFSFILLDLDHFKKVNDTLGHQFGDLVLRETAGLIREQMRGEDTLTRYGGEEFAIILPHTDLEPDQVRGGGVCDYPAPYRSRRCADPRREGAPECGGLPVCLGREPDPDHRQSGHRSLSQ